MEQQEYSDKGQSPRIRSSQRAARLAVLTLFAWGWSTSWGCPAQSRPLADKEYTTIVLAEVVGVRLTDYADARLRQIREQSRYAWGSDASPGYEVDVIAVEVLKGSAPDRLTLQVPRGCAIPTADLSSFGVFYVNQQGKAFPVYQDDHEYRDRLVKLGSHYTAPCTTGNERFSPHPCWKPRRELLECISQVKDIAYYYRSSCPVGVQELRERLNSIILGRYDWQLPPQEPSSLR